MAEVTAYDKDVFRIGEVGREQFPVEALFFGGGAADEDGD